MVRYYLRKYKTILQLLLMTCMVSAVTLAVCLGIDLYRLFYQPMSLPPEDALIFKIDKSSSATSFAHMLQSQHVIRSGRVFLNLIRLQGHCEHLKAGIYQIRPGESAEQLLRRVIAGDVLKETFTIIEGTTQKQLISHLETAPFLKYQKTDWVNAVCEPSNTPLTPALCGASHSNNEEGLFLAETYQYTAGSDATGLLHQAHTLLKQTLQKAWDSRDPQLPYKNPYELLIVASILEKEAAIPEERRLIAGIVVNRLAHHMPLQMDPTVIYALGDAYTGKLVHDDLQIDSPYNTYRYRGLPPTPIAMVGKQAIEAASHPQRSNYLYFVAKGDGTHIFSETYDEQRQAIREHL